MAIIHQATITPTKPELLAMVLAGPVEVVGSYRFDDPDGHVGIEGFVVRREDALHHVAFSYRGAPLDGADAHLVSTMEHSVLGQRWIYDAAADPIAVGCFQRALVEEQDQAVMEIWKDGEVVDVREPTIALTVVVGTNPDAQSLVLSRNLDDAPSRTDGPTDGPTLLATWAEGSAVIAALEPSPS